MNTTNCLFSMQTNKSKMNETHCDKSESNSTKSKNSCESTPPQSNPLATEMLAEKTTNEKQRRRVVNAETSRGNSASDAVLETPKSDTVKRTGRSSRDGTASDTELLSPRNRSEKMGYYSGDTSISDTLFTTVGSSIRRTNSSLSLGRVRIDTESMWTWISTRRSGHSLGTTSTTKKSSSSESRRSSS